MQQDHFSLLNQSLCISHKLSTVFQALTEKLTYLEIRGAGLKILLVRRTWLDAVGQDKHTECFCGEKQEVIH